MMITPSLPRVGAIAAATALLLSGCASGNLGVSPETVLSTVVANLPTVIDNLPSSTTTTTSSRGGTSSARRHIPSSPPPTATASRVLHTADSYLGTKYVWGGNTPHEGFDCSGFTKYIFAKYGVTLPRTSRDQSRVGRAVPPDFNDLRAGDLMFFAEPGQAISHVAIYAGNGVIIHSSSSVGGVGYTNLSTGSEWFVDYFVAARRVM
jgi:cell wall-associated NlpC family hydrolase